MTWRELRVILLRLGVDVEFISPNADETKVQLPCPLAPWFHKGKEDTNPSMGIKFGGATEWTIFNCFACKESGKLWQLVDSIGNLADKEELIELATHLMEYDKPSLAARFQATKTFLDDWVFDAKSEKPVVLNRAILDGFDWVRRCPRAARYLESRGILSDSDWSFWNLRYDERQDRIVFPVYSPENELQGAVGRVIANREPKYYNYFGFTSGQTLGGVQWLKDDRKHLLLVEGCFDLMKCYSWAWSAGYDVVCVWRSTITSRQAEMILGLDKTITVCYDVDEAGMSGWEKTRRLLERGTFGLRRALWSENVDVGEMSKDFFLGVLKKTRRTMT